MHTIFYERNYILQELLTRDRWAPVTTEWRVLGLRMEERPSVWSIAANVLNKQAVPDSRQGGSCSWGVGRGANNSSPYQRNMLRNIHTENTCECSNGPI